MPVILDQQRSFDHGDDTPAAARRFAAEFLGGTSFEPMKETLMLLVSEVVTNAVQHTHSAQVIVELAHIDVDTVRCAVTDDAAEQAPTVMSTEPSRVGGLGMAIVESLSSRWGCERDGSSKSVWFELDRPRM